MEEDSPPRRVASPPGRPLLLYDGDCGFCRVWIARWRLRTGGRVDYAPSQEEGGRFPEIAPEEFRRSVQLVLPDGKVLSGAHAVLASLAAGGHGFGLGVYRRVPGAAPAAEAGYAFVARHRGGASAVTRALWGGSVLPRTHSAAAILFLRLLGLVFLAAFVSVWFQVDGLVGSRGILPVRELLTFLSERLGAERFWLVPTLSWFDASDGFLHAQCAAGAVLSILLALGFFPAACAAGATVLYLSLSAAGQTFFSFQWDTLLVEAGFLAIFLAPLSARLRFPSEGPRRTAVFLLRWLVFRLNFSSGVVKLGSGDASWRHATALSYYYETQPLPPWTAWYFHRLPASGQTISVFALLFVELAAAFCVFGPRRVRIAGFVVLVLLQASIFATGNYAFFNVLAAILCLVLLDDETLASRRLRKESSGDLPPSLRPTRLWPRPVGFAVAAGIVAISATQLTSMLSVSVPGIRPAVALARAVEPLRLVNSYGLFAVMTTRRDEIVVEGSADGRTWTPYEFRWKPGDVRRRPAFVAPHQPRLDWQMWFAALGSFEESPWFGRFLARLVEGSPAVVGLLASNPFPTAPPRFVRARLFRYHFTDAAERRATGAWWRREEIGLYAPELGRP
ncbi:MAG: lipase maturation factor family protein [Acidobacteriota bacterium]